jgi:hypothetical protein
MKLKNKETFNRNVLIVLTNNSHEMFTYFNKHLKTHRTVIACRGELFEKHTTINYTDKNTPMSSEGIILISYYESEGVHWSNTNEENRNALLVKIRIHIKQKCIHDIEKQQFTVSGHDNSQVD